MNIPKYISKEHYNHLLNDIVKSLKTIGFTKEDFETTEHNNDCVINVIEETTYHFIEQCDGFNYLECDLGQWQRRDLNNNLYNSVIEVFNNI